MPGDAQNATKGSLDGTSCAFSLLYVVHVSLLYNNVPSTQALYTAILVFTVSLGFVHTRFVSLASVVDIFPILLSISASIVGLFTDGKREIGELMVRLARGLMDCFDEDVCLLQTDGQPKVFAGLKVLSISDCSSACLCPATAASSANSMSVMMVSLTFVF